MSFFKRKKEKSDITVEERGMKNKKAVENLLNALAVSGDASMEKWRQEIKELKNG